MASGLNPIKVNLNVDKCQWMSIEMDDVFNVIEVDDPKVFFLEYMMLLSTKLCFDDPIAKEASRRIRKLCRRHRAVRRGYVAVAPSGHRHVLVQASLYARAKDMVQSLALHRKHNSVSGVPAHYARDATRVAAAGGGITARDAATALAQHRRANRAKHSWSLDVGQADLAPTPSTDAEHSGLVQRVADALAASPQPSSVAASCDVRGPPPLSGEALPYLPLVARPADAQARLFGAPAGCPHGDDGAVELPASSASGVTPSVAVSPISSEGPAAFVDDCVVHDAVLPPSEQSVHEHLQFFHESFAEQSPAEVPGATQSSPDQASVLATSACGSFHADHRPLPPEVVETVRVSPLEHVQQCTPLPHVDGLQEWIDSSRINEKCADFLQKQTAEVQEIVMRTGDCVANARNPSAAMGMMRHLIRKAKVVTAAACNEAADACHPDGGSGARVHDPAGADYAAEQSAFEVPPPPFTDVSDIAVPALYAEPSTPPRTAKRTLSPLDLSPSKVSRSELEPACAPPLAFGAEWPPPADEAHRPLPQDVVEIVRGNPPEQVQQCTAVTHAEVPGDAGCPDVLSKTSGAASRRKSRAAAERRGDSRPLRRKRYPKAKHAGASSRDFNK